MKTTQLARQLRQFRLDTDKTLADVALLARVSIATVWRLERGKRGNARTEYKIRKLMAVRGNGHDSLDGSIG